MPAENTLVLRGLSLRLIKKYLAKMNAVETQPNQFSGGQWSVTLASRTVKVLKSDMEEITVAFDGEQKAVETAIAELRKKTLRGGG